MTPEPELVDRFRESSGLSDAIEAQERLVTPEESRREVVREEIETMLIGREVRVTEVGTEPGEGEVVTATLGLKGVRNSERPISRYGILNQSSIFRPGFAGVRSYRGGKHEYLPSSFPSHRSTLRGKVVGVDPDTSSIVIRPRHTGILGDRYWVKMVDGDGQPLVNVEYLD